MRIGGITDFSTVDWYGCPSMVVFFAGCNFKCPYCQNSALIPTDSGEEVELGLLRDRMQKALTPVETIEAVVFTGGEPTLQGEELIDAAQIVKDFGLMLMLDTNGSITESFNRIIDTGLIDRVALDVKAPLNEEDYRKVSGSKKKGLVESIREAIRICKDRDIPLEARTTVAPTISDDPDSIRMISEEISGKSTVYYLQQYDNHGEILDSELKEMAPPTRDRMIELADIACSTGLRDVYIKTRRNGLERVC
ncbi:MAG: anaerobic ribonucleoside-triphosphate reductase activating protein [Candidatus Bathyarchaeia archaeon]